jgi:glycosyltransferase involved in cell wall biosynthesis
LPARIAFCITDFDDGGAERHLAELATRLPRERYEPAVVVLSGPPRSPADQLLHMVSEHGISVKFLGGLSILSTPTVCWQLREWLRGFKPHLLQCYLAHANILGALAAHQAGVAHIVTGIQVAELRRNWHIALQRITARLADKHVCVSRSVTDFAAKDMLLPREKLLAIPNGIEMERWVHARPTSLSRLGLSPNRGMILFAGRLDPQKRPDWLLNRMPAVFDRLPDHDLAIAGEGPLRSSLGRLAEQLGISDRIHFVGWQPDMPSLLAAADAVVLTSQWEGMPNIVLEAMAAGRPIVTTDVHGVRELLGDETTPQISPANEAQAFVNAVAKVCNDRTLSAHLGQLNQERARAFFSIDAMVAAYCKLYDSLLANETKTTK